MTYRILVVFFAIIVLAGCNFAPLPQGGASPTPQEITLTVPPSPEPSTTPSPSPSPQPIVETATPFPSPEPPTIPPPPSETPGPYEHTVQQDETLGFIIQLYGYRDFAVIDEIVRINDNIPNADTLPGPGAVILIPRQTATPPADPNAPPPTEVVGIEPTNEQTGLNVDVGLLQHSVLEGQTIVDIASQYSTTLEVLARLNPDIDFFGCNFEIPSGGERCNPLLQIAQLVNVPAPTPTPTLSPTPSGSETPTPTPTFAAPRIVWPPQDAANVPPAPFRLEWVSVGVLLPNQVYLVQVEDVTAGIKTPFITRETSYTLPESLIPTDGQPHSFQWTVAVAEPNEQGVYRIVGAPALIRRFSWQSR